MHGLESYLQRVVEGWHTAGGQRGMSNGDLNAKDAMSGYPTNVQTLFIERA